jgi:hypothetical protein
LAVATKQILDLANENTQVGRHGTANACRPARREAPRAARAAPGSSALEGRT